MASSQLNGSEQTFSSTEVAYHLQVAADTLRSWNRRFARFLSAQAGGDEPRYTTADVAALVMVQKLVEGGLSDEQVGERLTPKRIVREEAPSLALSADQGRQLVDAKATLMPQALGDMLSAIANSQQSVLNSQSTVREVVGVVVQDNLGLKEENRKLRDRMLELERVLAEYQRREETRKERYENRLRQPKRRGWW
jgi:regulator of replication initiation timing